MQISGNPKWENGTATYRINDNMGIPGLGQTVWENAIVAAHGTWNNSGSAFTTYMRWCFTRQLTENKTAIIARVRQR
jgi:hypothetical protein